MTPEEKSVYNKEYYRKNKEKIAKKEKERYENKREEILKSRKEYRDNNKEKLAVLRKEYYGKHKEDILEKNKRSRYNRKIFIDQYRKPCIVCGEDEKACIDFHHLDPNEKEFSIGAGCGAEKDKLIKEIEKCVCLCSNCHRKFHAGLIELSAYVETT